MPARSAAPDACLPSGFFRFVWRFPESKVPGVFLLVLVRIDAFAATLDVTCQVDLRKFSVFWKGFDPVIDRAVRFISMIALLEFCDQLNHLRNVLRRTRGDLWPFTAERVKVFPKGVNVLLSIVVDGHAALLRFRHDAVVDIGEVHDVRHAQALELQIPANNISGDCRAKISDVAVIPNRGAAIVKLRFALDHWAKLFELAGKCVVDAEHWMRV